MPASESGLVRRTIWILRAVAAHPNGVGLSDVARTAGIPKATCYRVLNVLERERWLVLDPETRKYRVSLGLLSIVGGLLDADGTYGRMQDVLRQLAIETQETAGFDVLLEPSVMVVAQAPGTQLIGQTLKPVPRTQPVWSTSTGRVLLAELDANHIRETFGQEFAAAGSAAPDIDVFIDSLGGVRDDGFSFVHDELELGAASVAAPVRVKGEVQYAVWIGGPSFRIDESKVPKLAEAVRAAAQTLGDLLSVTGMRIPGTSEVR